MKQVQKDDTVKVHYKGTLNDGNVFDSSEGREPLEFTVGAGQVIPGFEQAVIGMQINEQKKIEIPFSEAYGPVRDELRGQVPRTNLPEDMKPEVGMQLQAQQESGEVMVVTVTSVDDESITVDANHPLAGKDLTFEISLVEIY
ncbi:MAG: peptidylprolyl isomerase [Flavobacteriales bacterium]|nr:peptidylprolyl isomerase [Flavobacteriales bacterium]MCB9448740.1 peptidylprolyl isomerase [Flavobacteriales bacterium]